MARSQQNGVDLKKVSTFFLSRFRKTSGEVIHDLSMQQKIPLSQVYEAHIYAVFDLLQAAIEAKRVFSGNLPSSMQPSFPETVKRREFLMNEILYLLADELALLDRRHDYRVAIARVEKPGPG